MTDNIRYIKSKEEEKLYVEEVRLRGKNFEPNPTTVSFGDEDVWTNMEAYDFNKEYLKVVKENNHETIYRIKY